ncbi:MAG: [FeFe] hydrogenase H-cluster maturation GTPase HydF [Synergistaceae bacterium]|nr:[FeFe] hydrogenase H-cluster maturation GTPase HydF [Synergistaceae bacterium]
MSGLNSTPRANRLHIGIFGKRNAGKSSLANLITGQNAALVSDKAGTTTDPVCKSMELLPLGPVEILDTAGFDDEGELGRLRVEKTEEMLNRADLALLVAAADACGDLSFEREWREKLSAANTPILGVLNKKDLLSGGELQTVLEKLSAELEIKFVAANANDKACRAELLSAIVAAAPLDFEKPVLCGDLFKQGDTVVLIAPQDKQAPKGRLILPQVQVIRDILDNRGSAYICTPEELPTVLASLKQPPALAITDSQVFAKVAKILPQETPLTSFSIIMARAKGELSQFISGARKIGSLKAADKVLIAEACTHAPINEDIGRVKIPRRLKQIAGEGLTVDIAAGADFPKDLSPYALIIHCGGCMFTRKQLMSRLIEAAEQNVPITNYGVALAYMNGILDRVVRVFENRL